MNVDLSVSFTGNEAKPLPPLEQMEAATKTAIQRLAAQRAAPLADGGVAVVLFEGRAAAQLLHSLLAPRLSGAPPLRYVAADLDRSLASKLGVEVVSPLLDVFDDPTLRTGPGGEALWGSYAADDEGVPARKVSLIERGVLKTLLMSRSPRKELRQSNGHFRLAGGGPTIGNLFVRSNRPSSRATLLTLAQAEAKKRGPNTKVYVVRRLSPRHAFAGGSPFGMHVEFPVSAESGMVAMEASVLANGKEQPVRGLTLEGVDLRALRDLVAAGSDAYVLNHGFGARTAIVAPSLLLSNVDVKRHEAESAKPPSYPAP